MEEKKPLVKFNYDQIPEGYYDKIAARARGMRSFWHRQKFTRVADCIPEGSQSILDIGCFAGTFLGMLPKDKVRFQVGVDILQKQVNFARKKYQNEFRKFYWIKNIECLNSEIADIKFQNICIIEVIEHLSKQEIGVLMQNVSEKLEAGGRLILTTPNYASIWPLLELAINLTSKVKYEEQHISRFNYFNFHKKLIECWPSFGEVFKSEFICTTHFISPAIATFSQNLAKRSSRAIPASNWKFPFGCLVLGSFIKVN